MIIEFNFVYRKVDEKLVTDIIKQLMKLIHIDKQISRAEVSLMQDETIIPSENKVCGIKLTVNGDDLMVQARSQTFEIAAKEAISELKKLIKHQVIDQKNVPDKVFSTIRL